jgi:hypothetical protein
MESNNILSWLAGAYLPAGLQLNGRRAVVFDGGPERVGNSWNAPIAALVATAQTFFCGTNRTAKWGGKRPAPAACTDTIRVGCVSAVADGAVRRPAIKTGGKKP